MRIARVRVRVQLAGATAVGALDLLGRGVRADAEQRVVVLGHGGDEATAASVRTSLYPLLPRLPVGEALAEAVAHDVHRGQGLRVVHARRAEEADGTDGL